MPRNEPLPSDDIKKPVQTLRDKARQSNARRGPKARLAALDHDKRRRQFNMPFQQKQRYINANMRFILTPLGDYTAHFADPDLMLSWSSILQVLYTTQEHEIPACPICLSRPVAPRMAACGHVFCFACALHFLAESESHKCPVCNEEVTSSDDLKPVNFVLIDKSDTATFRLMARPKLTTMALPRSRLYPSDAISPNEAPWTFTPDAFHFAKFMRGSVQYLISEFQRDLSEIQSEMLAPENDDISLMYLELAHTAVESALMSINETINIPSVWKAEEASAERYTASPEAEVPKSRRKNVDLDPLSDSSEFLFYQAENGAPMYLSALDVRILKSAFDSYTNFPNSITVHIDGSQELLVDDSFRKRCKYLSHLPEATSITVVDADLSGVVSHAVLKPYTQALQQRSQRRADKERREDRAKHRSEAHDMEKLLAHVPISSSSSSHPRSPSDWPSLSTSVGSNSRISDHHGYLDTNDYDDDLDAAADAEPLDDELSPRHDDDLLLDTSGLDIHDTSATPNFASIVTKSRQEAQWDARWNIPSQSSKKGNKKKKGFSLTGGGF